MGMYVYLLTYTIQRLEGQKMNAQPFSFHADAFNRVGNVVRDSDQRDCGKRDPQ